MGFQGLKAVIKAVLVSFQVRSVSLGWWQSRFCLLMAWDTVSIPSRQAAPKEDYITDISRLQGGSLMVRMVILVGRSIIKALKDAAHSRPSESSSFLCALCYHVCCLLVWLQCFERMRFFSHCTPIGLPFYKLSLSLSLALWILVEHVSVLSSLVCAYSWRYCFLTSHGILYLLSSNRGLSTIKLMVCWNVNNEWHLSSTRFFPCHCSLVVGFFLASGSLYDSKYGVCLVLLSSAAYHSWIQDLVLYSVSDVWFMSLGWCSCATTVKAFSICIKQCNIFMSHA